MAIGGGSQMTAFELYGDILLLKTFLNMTVAIQSCLEISQQLVREGKLQRGNGCSNLIVTWLENARGGGTNRRERAANTGIFSQEWISSIQDRGSSIIQQAFDAVSAGHNKMLVKLSALRSLAAGNKIESLFCRLRDIFMHDEWVRSEYAGGSNTHSLADSDSVEDVIMLG